MLKSLKVIICLGALFMMYSCTPVIYTTPTAQAPPPQVVTPPPTYTPPPTPPPPVIQPQEVEYGPQPTYQVFYDELTPYGSWVEYPSYGYVWIPRVGPDFEPYSTNGHWVYTDQGWTWYSDYSWGWAPFHYGRWFVDNNYGWIWVPGHEWAPAWVTWGTYNNYYCWAPISPGVTEYDTYRPPRQYWHFVPSERITDEHVNDYVVDNRTAVDNENRITIINNRNNYNNVTYNQGPKREEVERATHRKIEAVPIKETSRPTVRTNNNTPKEKEVEKKNEQNNSMPVYRPKVVKDNEIKNTQAKPAPKKVEKIENIQPYKKQPGKNVQDQKKKPELNPKENKEEDKQKHNEDVPVKQ